MLREPELEPLADAPENEDDPEGLVERAAKNALREGEHHTSAMVALYPDAATAAELAVAGGEDANDLHVTLAFLGKAKGKSLKSALNAVRAWAATCPLEGLSGEISGVGHFADSHKGTPITYRSIDLPALPDLREQLVRDLDAAGVPPNRDHGFTPHMTIDYKKREPKIEIRPITFTTVTLSWGDEQYTIPLGIRSDAGSLYEAVVAPFWLELQEGKWDPTLHPRWPKGTPKAGQFMRVGEHFIGADGKEWQIAHIVRGKVISHRVGVGYKDAETGIFQSEKEGDKHVIKDAKQEATPKPLSPKETPGKSLNTGVATVSPYVDHGTHDPSITMPENSPISEDEWARFGQIEQEHYSEVMQRFGKYSPGKAKSLIDESYSDYDAEIQGIVKTAYKHQYGGSSGATLSLASIYNGFKNLMPGAKAKKLKELNAQRQKALELQGRHKDVIAWDLYNRTHSPDVAVFHKDDKHDTNYWQGFIDKDKPILSGLSQSFKFGANHDFGAVTLATPVSIRHVLMSTYSAQPVPGETHFDWELEIAIAEQLKLDKRSITFNLHNLSANQSKWLMGETNAPASGSIIERFQEALNSGEVLPTPAAPADIEMQGASQKLWIDPPPEAAEATQQFTDKLPPITDSPYNAADLDKTLPWANKDAAGNPVATVAKESDLKPGDFMMGLKGTLYQIVEDPGDPTGFGLRYEKIVNGKFTGEGWNFEGGGANLYYKLDLHFDLPDPKEKDQKKTDLFDPHAWVNGPDAAFLQTFGKGDKFKVNGIPYEVVTQLSGANTQIKDLTDGKIGTINNDYKAHKLVSVEGYVPGEDVDAPKLKPQKGMTFAHEGVKHTVTTVLKDGTVKAKPSGGKTIAVGADDADLETLYDPKAHKIGGKVAAGDLEKGDLFHGGKGSAHRPYVVIDKTGGAIAWKSLDTGEEGNFTKAKIVRRLEDSEPTVVKSPEQELGQALASGLTKDDVGGFNPDAWTETGEVDVGELAPGEKFMWDGAAWEMRQKKGESVTAKSLNGDDYEMGMHVGITVNALTPSEEGKKPTFNPDEYTPLPQMEVGDLATGELFAWNDKAYLLGEKDTLGGFHATNVDDGKVHLFAAQIGVTPLAKKDEVDPEQEPDKGPLAAENIGEKHYLGDLKPGQFYEADGEVFAVVKPAPGIEDNVTVAPVMPSGTLGPMTSAGAFPTKHVVFKGDGPASKFAQTETPSSEGMPDLVEAGGFDPYKSKHGSGGKYTHDKLGEMNVGTVFQDKKGQLWKIKANDHSLIVTNGAELFSANPDLRGKVTGDDFVDQVGPLPGPGTDAATADAAKGLTDNWPNTKMGELPIGSKALVTGQVHTIEHEGTHVMHTTLPDGNISAIGKEVIPDKVGIAAQKPQTIGGLEPDSTFVADGQQHTVVAHSTSGTIIKSADGSIQQLPANTPWGDVNTKVDEPKPKKTPGPKKEKAVKEMPQGEVFEGAGGQLHEVVATKVNGEVVVSMEAHNTLASVPAGTPLNHIDASQKSGIAWQFSGDPIPAPGEGGFASQIVAEALSQAGTSMDDVPTLNLSGYASKWGSGGKYQHHMLEELAPGSTFKDKTGLSYTYMGPAFASNGLIKDANGDLHIASQSTRVKLA